MTKEQQSVIDNAKVAKEEANEAELHHRYLTRSRIENILDKQKLIMECM